MYLSIIIIKFEFLIIMELLGFTNKPTMCNIHFIFVIEIYDIIIEKLLHKIANQYFHNKIIHVYCS